MKKVTLHRAGARLVRRWMTIHGHNIPSGNGYVSSHPGQLSLLPSMGWEMSTGQEAVLVRWDNRRSDVALAMRHKLYDTFTFGLTKGDELTACSTMCDVTSIAFTFYSTEVHLQITLHSRCRNWDAIIGSKGHCTVTAG